MLHLATELIVAPAKGGREPHARAERIHEVLVGDLDMGRVNGLCTPSLRLIPTAWKPSTIPSFQPYLRGACHGLYALFLPVSAGRACMAVRHASLGVAQRLRHCVSDYTGAPMPTS